MTSTTIIEAMIVTLSVYLTCAALVTVLGPFVDKVDETRQTMDYSDFTTAAETMSQERLWFYAVIGIACAVTTVWFFLVIIAKILYRRQEAMMQPYNQYTAWRRP